MNEFEARKQARMDAILGEQTRNLVHLDALATMHGQAYEAIAALVVDLILGGHIPDDRVQTICTQYPDIQQRVKSARDVTTAR